jgi:LuxR family transcriptional regulator, maltose regulon positive regulatory protein
MQLLATKFHAPPEPLHHVPRQRLLAQVDEGLSGSLTLISAPAGYGKTTLLSEWRASAAGQRWPLSWLSLDESDSDPARFLTYLIAALQRIDPAIGHATQGMLQSPQLPPPEALLTALINDVANIAAPFVLVFDDYHVIDSPPVQQHLAFLLDHQPPQLRVIILTREDPPLPLSRLRAGGQVAEIRQADLQFTPEETAAFLRQAARLDLDQGEVAVVQQRTEGWIAGLQLLALSLRGRADARQLIQSFAGSDRYILDYLTDEVFRRQSPDVQDFLLKTSILDRLSAPLCDAVAEREDSRTRLPALEHANLFVVPLDPAREWYRYHHLFADLLQHRLKVESPRAVPQLHQRASQWYAAHGFRDDAIHHALAAADWERAAELISLACDDLLKRGETVTLLKWYGALPQDLVRARSNLCLEYSWPLIFAAQLDEAESYLRQAEQNAQNDPALLGKILTAQAFVARTRGDGRQAFDLSQRALSLLLPDDDTSRSVVAINLGMAYWYAGRLAAAQQMLGDARDAAQRSGNNYAAAMAQIFLCRILAARGQLHQAAAAYEQFIAASGSAPTAALALIDLARLLYEWNDLEAAAQQAQRGVESSQRGGNAEVVLGSYRTLALIKQAQGDTAAAQAALQDSIHLAVQPGLSPSAHWHELAYRVLIALLGRDLAACAPLIDQYPALEQLETLPDYLLLSSTYARWLLWQGQRAACAEVLTTRYEKANRAGALQAHVETRALQALAAASQAEALSFLGEALTLAEPEGYVRTFVDLGEPLRMLIAEWRWRNEKQMHAAPDYTAPSLLNYATRLLTAFDQPSSNATPAKFHTPPSDFRILVEPLTERELEILRLLPTELSTHELAEHFVVSINTIKTQLKSIYAKLDAHSREEAVEKAKTLALI